VPMVAVTGYSMFDDRSRSLTSGFNEHVTKPIDPRAFLELIEQL
jgi:CheY-like chemotaxis protein